MKLVAIAGFAIQQGLKRAESKSVATTVRNSAYFETCDLYHAAARLAHLASSPDHSFQIIPDA
jgi:hypothetical protein